MKTPADKTALRQNLEKQVAVAKRLERDHGDVLPKWRYTRSSFLMDLDSCPDLDLDALLAFPAFDFAHDCFGIMRHMDRKTYPGKLTDCFVPRSTR